MTWVGDDWSREQEEKRVRSLCGSWLLLRLLSLARLFCAWLPAKALIVVALEGKELQEVSFAVKVAVVGGVVAQVQDNFTVDTAKAGPVERLLVSLDLLHWICGLLTDTAHVILCGPKFLFQ